MKYIQLIFTNKGIEYESCRARNFKTAEAKFKQYDDIHTIIFNEKEIKDIVEIAYEEDIIERYDF